VQTVDDGNDVAAIEQALQRARDETTRPSLVLVRTHIGYGSPEQDSFKAHGSPLGEKDVAATKRNLGWPEEPPFLLPDDTMAHFRSALDRGKREEEAWQEKFDAYGKAFPDEAAELRASLEAKLPEGWDADIPVFPADAKGMATREAGGKVLSAIAPKLPALTGGSADLDPSTFTAVKGLGDFDPRATPGEDEQGSTGGGWSYAGRNLHFGVREHAMGAICNGMAAHGGVIPYDATFLIFSDYMRPPMRLAALMRLHVVHVFTHDSIALGEDGPTHQPVEQLAGLRSVPDLLVIRPADANETAVAWRVALEAADQPVAFALSRQKVPTLDRDKYASADGLRKGAYVLLDAKDGEPEVVLIGTGAETGLVLSAAEKLQEEGIAARAVSMPCWSLFDGQPPEYRDSVLPPGVAARLAVEAGSPQGWHRYVGDRGDVLGVDRFGASAPGSEMLERYGFTADNVCARARKLLGKEKS
jgi:transketolase